jgi:AbrB family looped-hinge helix DNA binding protein
MKATHATDAVCFSVKGQIVIPRRLRREFGIEAGTRAIVQATSEGILLKPVTKARIQQLRGILKRKADKTPFAQEWAGYKAEEKALEEAKHARVTGSR